MSVLSRLFHRENQQDVRPNTIKREANALKKDISNLQKFIEGATEALVRDANYLNHKGYVIEGLHTWGKAQEMHEYGQQLRIMQSTFDYLNTKEGREDIRKAIEESAKKDANG